MNSEYVHIAYGVPCKRDTGGGSRGGEERGHLPLPPNHRSVVSYFLNLSHRIEINRIFMTFSMYTLVFTYL